MPRQRQATVRWLAPILFGCFVLVALPLGMAVAQDENRLTIPLQEYEDSGVSGTATLQAVDDATHVTMMLQGAAVMGDHPTHIHTGTCDDFDPNPIYPLTTFILDPVSEAGVSETTVEDVSLRELLRDDYVILVHESPNVLTNYLVCGDIKRSAAIAEIPVAGVGGGSLPWTALLGALAVLSAAYSGALRFRRGTRAL
jgi:hypothetical protein